jgi:hypothetical protein
MKKAILFRVVIVLAAMIALSWLPQTALAQRGGGHGGGGGFHGGGGGGFHGGGGGAFRGGGGFSGGGRSGFGGGRSLGGFRGGGFNRGRGGFGWGGRGWGRGFGNGWGWGWGFGFGWPYWGWGWGYPYASYYGPGYYAPDPYYSYPYYGPSDDPTGYPDPGNGNDNPRPPDPNTRPRPNQNGPAKPWRPPVPEGAPNENEGDANIEAAAVAPSGPVRPADRMSVTSSNYRAAGSIPAHFIAEQATTERAAPQTDAPLRPEVQKALQRLREMPPFARKREIETGRYRQFSPEEKQVLRNGE